MTRFACCYVVVGYNTAGEINDVSTDVFTLSSRDKDSAEAEIRSIALKWNPDKRVHVCLAKAM